MIGEGLVCECFAFEADPDMFDGFNDDPVCMCGHTLDEHDEFSGECLAEGL